MRKTALVVLAVVSTFGTTNYAENTRSDNARATRVKLLFRGSMTENVGFTAALAINNRREVVGFEFDSSTGIQTAFLWTLREGFRQIATDAAAIDINERGDVVGQGLNGGFLWTKSDGLRELGGFLPSSINNRGDMAGVCTSGEPCVVRKGVLSAGSTPSGFGLMTDINERGDAVGRARFGVEEFRLFWPRKGRLVTGEAGSVAEGINNRGTIVGWRFRNGEPLVTAWTKTSVASPKLTGSSVGFGINSRGDVVGAVNNRGLFWNRRTGTLVRFGKASDDTVAFDINDHGDIVGEVSSQEGFPIEMAVWRVHQ
jgi:uncharacterized membrane protein